MCVCVYICIFVAEVSNDNFAVDDEKRQPTTTVQPYYTKYYYYYYYYCHYLVPLLYVCILLPLLYDY